MAVRSLSELSAFFLRNVLKRRYHYLELIFITGVFTMLLRIRTLFMPLLLLWSASVFASLSPQAMLNQVTDSLLAELQAQRTEVANDPSHLFELVDRVLVPHVDIQRMAQFALGTHWRGASAEQRQRFTAEFRTLLVRFYTAALLDDPRKLDEILEVGRSIIALQPEVIAADGRSATVRGQVNLPKRNMEVPLAFRLIAADGGWKVIDVTVEGISIITNYRKSFDSDVRRDGLEQVIVNLSERNRALLQQTKGSSETTP
jgi:phospholipid transport system substrate-binding protein